MALSFIVRNFLFSMRLCTGGLLLTLGLFGIGAGLWALIDPVGLKGADDNDPLGPPPTTLYSLWTLVLFSLVFGSGLWLTLTRRWKQVELHSPTSHRPRKHYEDPSRSKPIR